MSNKQEKAKELEDVKAKLVELGIEFDEKADIKALKKLLKEATKGTGGYIIWLKNKTYITDDKRVDAGVYAVNEVPARLKVLKSDNMVVFEGEVPSRDLAKIAKWAGIDPDGLEDDVLFEKLVQSEMKLY